MTLLLVIGDEKLESGKIFSDDKIGKEFLKLEFLDILKDMYEQSYLPYLSTERNANLFIKEIEYPEQKSVYKKMMPKIYQNSFGRITELFQYEENIWNEFKKSIL